MKKAAKLVLFLLVAVMVLTACQPAATETPAVVEEAPAEDASGMS